MFSERNSDIHKIELKDLIACSQELYMLREDRIDPFVSGNKFRKLRYNLEEAKIQGKSTLLTYGGAYSNHIAAVAAAGKREGFKTIGVIRGEELAEVTRNTTLSYAEAQGMELHFISREAYRDKETPSSLLALIALFGDFYVIPEGGTNSLAVRGCEEILSLETRKFDYICLPVGTGGTISGVIKASQPHQTIIGFSALKGTFQISEIQKHTSKTNFELVDEFCFGGYGKIDGNLVRFINGFKKESGVSIDPVYTGKMMYGITEMMKAKKFKENSRILAVHTGGLQGIAGMNVLLKKKQLPQIE